MPTIADDHAEIRNLLAKYCLLLDLDDMDGWLQLFTDDAVYEVYGHQGVGRDGIRKLLTGAPGGLHLGGPPVIELDGDRATTLRNLLFVEAGYRRPAQRRLRRRPRAHRRGLADRAVPVSLHHH